MHQHLNEYSTAAWCQGLSISRSGYYAWRARLDCERVELSLIRRIYQAHGGKFGAPCLRTELLAKGISLSQRSIGRRMRALGLRTRPRRKYRHTPDSTQAQTRAPDLLARQF